MNTKYLHVRSRCAKINKHYKVIVKAAHCGFLGDFRNKFQVFVERMGEFGNKHQIHIQMDKQKKPRTVNEKNYYQCWNLCVYFGTVSDLFCTLHNI